MKATAYLIVTAKNLIKLQEMVNERIKKGNGGNEWEIISRPFKTKDGWNQTMVKLDDWELK
jgi:hypothetical protein